MGTKYFTEEHRAKLRAAQLGRKRTEETKRKISAGSRKFWKRIRKLQAEAEARAA